MRIIAGAFGGRTIQGPGNTKGVRPTSDRARESLFNTIGQWLDGICVLDLFSGTGALGLEALSRGATSAVLVDVDLKWARKNAATLGAKPEFLEMPWDRAVNRLHKEQRLFDLIFADPPYAMELAEQLVSKTPPVMSEGATLVIEHSKRENAPTEGLIDQRRMGDTVLSIYRR